MPSLTTALGLNTGATTSWAPAYLAFHFIFAYGVLSSRTPKQILGIDHQAAPREDLAKYGEDAVSSGKITRQQLDMLKRNEAAHANSVENFTLLVGAMAFATSAGVDRGVVNRAGLTYTIGRVVYALVYVLVSDSRWAQIRGVAWWVGNGSCLWLLREAWKSLNRA